MQNNLLEEGLGAEEAGLEPLMAVRVVPRVLLRLVERLPILYEKRVKSKPFWQKSFQHKFFNITSK